MRTGFVPHTSSAQLKSADAPAQVHAVVQRLQTKKSHMRAALALYFAYYNFVKIHSSIRMKPAMKAGVAREPWKLWDLLAAAMVG
jgi:hypothetical protein